MTKPELLPCPFCGHEAALGHVRYGANSDEARLNGQATFNFANCMYCGATTRGPIGQKSPDLAREKWNRRATPNAGGAPDTRLLEALTEIIWWLLGERGAFPEPPTAVPGKPIRRYWWRGELRRRFEEATRAFGPNADTQTTGRADGSNG